IALLRDGEMPNGEITLDEIPIVFRIKDRALDVVSREALDGIERLPERQRDDLGAVADVALQDVGAAIARRRPVPYEARAGNVVGVRRAVLAARGAAPDARDHRPAVDGGFALFTLAARNFSIAANARCHSAGEKLPWPPPGTVTSSCTTPAFCSASFSFTECAYGTSGSASP